MGRWDNTSLGMSDITIDKAELVATVIKNRATHSAAYKEAVAAYRVAALKRLTELASDVQADPPRQVMWSLPLPEHHLGDYDKALRMLAMDLNAEVVLPEDAYDRLVEDHWDWHDRFVASTLSYTAAKV